MLLTSTGVEWTIMTRDEIFALSLEPTPIVLACEVVCLRCKAHVAIHAAQRNWSIGWVDKTPAPQVTQRIFGRFCPDCKQALWDRDNGLMAGPVNVVDEKEAE